MADYHKKGLSMIEITFSVGILAIIMLPVFMTFSSGNRNMQMTDSEFRAHTAAIELMEQIVSLPFSLIPVGNFGSEKVADGKGFGNSQIQFKLAPNPDMKHEVKVESIKRDNKIRFKKITVTIRFPAAKGSDRIRIFNLKTLVANENI